MEQNSMVENMTKIMTDTLKDLAKTGSVIGEPFKMADFTVVPAVSISIGFGVGGGKDNGTNQNQGGSGVGGGGGIKVTPLAFLVAAGQEVDLLNLGRGKGLEAVFESMPAVIGEAGEAIKGLIGKSKKSEEDEKEEGVTKASPVETKFKAKE